MLNDPKISDPWGVATFGAATVAAEPDFARVKVELATLEQGPAEAFQAAQTVIIDFRAVLRAHGIPDAGVSPSRLKLATHYEYSRTHDERRHGITLGRVLHIEDVDPERLKTYSHSGVSGGVDEDFAPGQIVVTAAVAMGFAIDG